MFGSRRPGKRSIVGTKVCALFDDGFYRPGVIQSVHIPANSLLPQTYAVTFDEGGTFTYSESQLIGPGFQNMTNESLKIGQKVFITFNSREVKGCIVGSGLYENGSGVDQNRYWLVGLGDDCNVKVKMKLDDIRLMESRKSARLSEMDTDYTKMADFASVENKKRSNCIDVPGHATKHCKSSHYNADEAFLTRDIEMEVMDENMAAMVLTSLSCSPISSHLLPLKVTLEHSAYSPGTSPRPIPNNNNTSSSSPTDSLLSHSAPSSINSFIYNHDDDNRDVTTTTSMTTTLRMMMMEPYEFSRTVYQCTWPGCRQIYNTCNGIEKHIRIEHLGPRSESDHEEEFYYSEFEVTMDSHKQQLHQRHHHNNHHNNQQITAIDSPTSPTSPTTTTFSSGTTSNIFFNDPTSDHNYQKKDSMSISIPCNPRPHHHHHHHHHHNPVPPSTPTNHYLTTSALSKSLPWQLPDQISPSPMNENNSSLFTGQPKSLLTNHKKSRNEVKKCRKVYGLENRAAWCTQCKWKKACTRFHEKSFDYS